MLPGGTLKEENNMPRINTNVSALRAQRILTQSDRAFGRSVARLSSGFRINRASDDAAGLGIANKIRADVGALQQASRNAEQAISLLQVAEGGAFQVEAIVERMKELASQSASDNVSDSDRLLIQAEFSELQSEITRIVSTTKFQGNVLLDGTLGNVVDTDDTNSTILAAGTQVQSAQITGATADTYTFSQSGADITLTNSAGDLTQVVTVGGGGKQTVSFSAFDLSIELTASFATTADTVAGNLVVNGGNTSFLVSVSGDPAGNDKVSLTSLDIRLATLGSSVVATGLAAESLSTKAGAEQAIGVLDQAIQDVSSVFGSIGAAQNRIEFALNNADTAIENFSAAQSVIRDVDVATESTEFARLSIQQQATTAMLAQANAAPQLVLQLLG
ncbi:MAG: flagellin [Gemmatimonadetes bacterium]|nr:flagellin [Gemmatimonadota bacterium]